jgi:hypothetical protein
MTSGSGAALEDERAARGRTARGIFRLDRFVSGVAAGGFAGGTGGKATCGSDPGGAHCGDVVREGAMDGLSSFGCVRCTTSAVAMTTSAAAASGAYTIRRLLRVALRSAIRRSTRASKSGEGAADNSARNAPSSSVGDA